MSENKDSDFLKQLRKDLVIEIIRKRALQSSRNIIYNLSVAHEAELLVLYITGQTSIDHEKLIEWNNNG